MTSPEKKKKLLIQAFFRFCLFFGVVAGFFLYQCWENGAFDSVLQYIYSIISKACKFLNFNS